MNLDARKIIAGLNLTPAQLAEVRRRLALINKRN